MEVTQSPPKSPFSDLFEPAKLITTQPAAPAPVASNEPTSPVSPQSAGSEASAGGTVTADQALSGLDHTRISTVSPSGAPAGAGPTPLSSATPSASVSLGGIIQGEWATNIMDAVLPAIIVVAFHYLGVKLRKSEVQMTEKEKQTVAPVMQKCLDSILLNFNNPWSALAWTLLGIYGGKLIEKGGIAWLEKKEERMQDEALKEKIDKAERADNPAKFDYTNASAADIQSGNVATPADPFTEQDIRARMKKGKCSREKAIEWLRRNKEKFAA